MATHEAYVQHVVLTCSLTLAVSRGKVTRSATQPAVPAESTFTAVGGERSALFPPAIINDSVLAQFVQQKEINK